MRSFDYKRDVAIVEISNHNTKRGYYEVLVYDKNGDHVKSVPKVVPVAKASPAGMILQAFLKQLEMAINTGELD